VVRTDSEWPAQEVLSEIPDERDYGEQLFPGHVVVPFVFVVQLAGVADWPFFAILHLGQDRAYR